MSAAELRKAAETLRKRAASVPMVMERSGAWDSGVGFRRDGGSWFHLAPTTYEAAQRGDFQAASRYIATMNPGVGLALADLLDREADALEYEQRWREVVDIRSDHPVARLAALVNRSAS